jgi:hypothetical protein
MKILVFLILLGIAAFIFWLKRNEYITEKGLNTLATVAGIVASVAAVVVIILPENSTEPIKSSNNSVFTRHLTAFNEYPALAIAEINIPRAFLDSINIDDNPIIYTENEVFRSIQNFKRETGSDNIFVERYPVEETSSIDYAVNQSGVTTQTKMSSEISNFNQNKTDFESDTIMYEGKAQEFNYAPVYAPFQEYPENAPWTLFGEMEEVSEINSPVGMIVQYPKFKNLDQSSLVSDRYYLYNFNSDEWIRNVIRANPESQGFLGFIYRYTLQYDNSFENGSCLIELIDVTPSSPYVRIFDIENISDLPINLEGFTYKILDKAVHEITELRNRNELFDGLPEQEKEINLMIPPHQHLFIPIEFGFSSKAHEQKLRNFEEISNPNILSNQDLFLIEPDNKLSDPNNPHQGTPLGTRVLTLSSDFISRIQPKETVLASFPRRFLVGAAIDLNSIKIDGKTKPIQSPGEEPSAYYTVSFGYGSCPYLLVYDAEKKYWIDLGNILSDRSEERLKNTESYSIERKVSKIRIEEREDEVSYIDSLSFSYADLNGNEKEISPSIPSLLENDKNYLILRKGEYLEISLQDLLPLDFNNLILKINGYYTLPDK